MSTSQQRRTQRAVPHLRSIIQKVVNQICFVSEYEEWRSRKTRERNGEFEQVRTELIRAVTMPSRSEASMTIEEWIIRTGALQEALDRAKEEAAIACEYERETALCHINNASTEHTNKLMTDHYNHHEAKWSNTEQHRQIYSSDECGHGAGSLFF